jgi:hypothetical protein
VPGSRFPLFIPQKIAIHHSASRRSTTFEQVERWHKAKGWPAIGYNHVITASGAGRVGRVVPQRCAAVKMRNTGILSILVMGHNSLVIPDGKALCKVPHADRRWTQTQVDGLAGYLVALFTVWPHLEDQVFGHRDVARSQDPTECPGLDIATLIALDWNIEGYWHENSGG